jgi:hypothetical protein
MLAYFTSGMCRDFLIAETGVGESSGAIPVMQSK